MSHLDLISDHSKEKLVELPKKVLDMTNLKMLFLEGNFLYNIPEDFFWKLSRLVWLDLRNNLLESLPKSIAYHKHLENLLLTNNNIQKLPNELGLVPNLKALQISENPLIYPSKKVIVEGTKAIKKFLKHQFELAQKEEAKPDTGGAPEIAEEEEEEEEEKRLNKIGSSSSDDAITAPRIHPKPTKLKKKKQPSADLPEPLKKKLADPKSLHPTLAVKKLYDKGEEEKKLEPVKIVHKISKTGSKILLKSTFNRTSPREQLEKATVNSLKEGWLNELRILLTDQEKILQQERNLKALAAWRNNRRTDAPKVFYDTQKNSPRPDPPYATYKEYSKMASRKELEEQLNTFLGDSSVLTDRRGADRVTSIDLEKLISDLSQQLADMETAYRSGQKSPRTEIEQAGKQIKTVMEIHKKLLQMKQNNDTTL